MVGQPTQETEHMMKKMWKKNSKAVSPVIATILMVAITVVLAAVLYVMVMGMSGGDEETTPTGVIDSTLNTTGNYSISITSVSPTTPITDLSYRVNATGALTQLVAGASFIDVGGDGKASNGDFFYVTCSAGSVVYLVYEPTGGVINSITV